MISMLLSLSDGDGGERLSRLDLENLLAVARDAHFHNVCEMIYELRGEYHRIVDCYLDEGNDMQRISRIFDIVRKIIQQLSTNTDDESRDMQPPQMLLKLQQRLVEYSSLRKMLAANPTEALHLLWIEMSLDLKQLVLAILQHIEPNKQAPSCNGDQLDESSSQTSETRFIPSDHFFISLNYIYKYRKSWIHAPVLWSIFWHSIIMVYSIIVP